MLIAALLPIAAGKISEIVHKKVSDKLSSLELSEKSKSFFETKYKNSSVYKSVEALKDKSLDNKKQKLIIKLKSELIKLKDAKESNKPLSYTQSQLRVIETIETSITDIEDQQQAKIKEQKKIAKSISKKLSALDTGFLQTDLDDSILNEEQTPNDTSSETSNTDNQISNTSKMSKKPSKENSTKVVNTILKNKGRPLGKKDSKKRKLKNDSSNKSISKIEKSNEPILTENNSVDEASLNLPLPLSQSSDIESSNIQTSDSTLESKSLKITNLLLLNSKKQLDELEDLNETLKKVDSDISKLEGASSNSILDSLTGSKKGGTLSKIVKSAPKILKGAAAVGTVIQGASIGYDYYSNNKEIENKKASGEIADDEYTTLKKQNKYKTIGKGGGMAAGLATGAAIGSVIPGIGTIIGGGIGALAGDYFGNSISDSLVDNLKSEKYLKSEEKQTGPTEISDSVWLNTVEKHNLGYSKDDKNSPEKVSKVKKLLDMESKKDSIKNQTEVSNSSSVVNKDLSKDTYSNYTNSTAIISDLKNTLNNSIFNRSDKSNEFIADFGEENRLVPKSVSAESIQDTQVASPISSKVSKFDNSIKESNQKKQEESSKVLASTLNTMQNKNSNTTIINSSSPSQTKVVEDDFVSSFLRFQVNF